MSDQTEAPAQPDTPTQTPAADTPPEVNWQKRYEDLQPEYTRATQTLSDPNRLLEYIQQNHPDLVAEEDAYEEPAPEPTPEAQHQADPRVDLHDEALQQLLAKQAADQFKADLTEELGDRTLPDKAREWIETRTLNTGGDRNALNNAVSEWFELTAPPEPEPVPPHVPNGGTAPSGPDKPPEDMTTQEINAWMVERLRAEQH